MKKDSYKYEEREEIRLAVEFPVLRPSGYSGEGQPGPLTQVGGQPKQPFLGVSPPRITILIYGPRYHARSTRIAESRWPEGDQVDSDAVRQWPINLDCASHRNDEYFLIDREKGLRTR